MQVAVDRIDICSGSRAVNIETNDQLGLHIKQFGLINPITVVENLAVPGRLICVAGRNRLNEVRKLGWEYIDASLRELNEVDRELVEIGENLWRTEYTAIERSAAFGRYVELYATSNPEVRAYLESTQRQNLKVGTAPSEADAPEKMTTPVAAVAQRFGVSKSKVYKGIARATKFTDEEKLVLRDRALSQKRIDELAKVDAGDKVQVVNLLGAGMAYPEAMKEVLGDKYLGDVEEDPQTDEEFLASLPCRRRTNTARFDADALFYRSIQKHKIAFGKAIGWGQAKSKVGEMGIYARRFMLFFDAKHPRDWIVCSQCVRGVTKDGDGKVFACNACKGGGYLIG